MPLKAVFLDRDGVLNSNEHCYYVYRPEDLRINPDVIPYLLDLQNLGYLLIVVSNQGGVGKGLYTLQDVESFHSLMQAKLEAEGVHIAAFYFCPHHESSGRCICRKPDSLLIEKALHRFCIDPAMSWLIGDSDRDIEAAQRAGVKGILVPSNRGIAMAAAQIFSTLGLMS